MADELTINAGLTFTKAPAASQNVAVSPTTFDVTGSKFTRGVQEIGTSPEVIGLDDIGTPGWFYIKNLDDTNYVEILDATDGAACLKLKPGEFAIGRFGSAAPAANADTAACDIEKLIIED
jgi:hypothetical protein